MDIGRTLRLRFNGLADPEPVPRGTDAYPLQ
jgi:hypothetical protein